MTTMIATIIQKIRARLTSAPNTNSNSLAITDRSWSPVYDTWNNALADSSKYEAEKILSNVKEAMLKIKNGEAVYERDGVIFEEIQYSWPLVASLCKVALECD